MPPDALYIHIPFCIRRCAYCAFASTLYTPALVEPYLDALEAEFERRAGHLAPVTLYIGGGTPTALSLRELGRLFRILELLDASKVREFTVEANPGTLSIDKLQRLLEAGVTRLSLGVQSFSDEGLRVLGRIHTAREARTAAALCHEAGFDDLSLDLITGWPGQTLAVWQADIERALACAPAHLSCYGLTYEVGTPLERAREEGRFSVVGEEEERAMLDWTLSYLPSRGFEHYEISSYTRPGHVCRHNVAYWEGAEYVGLGAGAHSYEDGVRFSNAERPDAYIRLMRESGSARCWEEWLPPEARARERAVIWLRMRNGIDLGRFARETGFSLENLYGTRLCHLEEEGWIERTATHLSLSARALPVADTILAELVT
ncbi:MAG: radical SAM family heme chaperone HemW [Planctomycetota bacterium]